MCYCFPTLILMSSTVYQWGSNQEPETTLGIRGLSFTGDGRAEKINRRVKGPCSNPENLYQPLRLGGQREEMMWPILETDRWGVKSPWWGSLHGAGTTAGGAVYRGLETVSHLPRKREGTGAPGFLLQLSSASLWQNLPRRYFARGPQKSTS